jgi:hypothetical protein
VVLVAQDRVHDLARLAGQLGQRRRVGELVLDRDERDVEPRRQPGHLRAPDPRREHDVLGADRAQRGLDARDAAALDHQPGQLAAAERGNRVGTAQRLRRPHPFGDPVVGDMEAADDRVRRDERGQLGDLPRIEQPRVEPVPARSRGPAVELGPALVGSGDLDAADRVIGADLGELGDGPLRQARHRPRRVVLEDQPRRV